MPERRFTKGLKFNLRELLENEFRENNIPLSVVSEFGRGILLAPDWKEYTVVDLAILPINYDRNKTFRFVAIEIEFVSSYEQIIKNFKKLLNYVSRHQNVKVGLFHLIFWETNISKRQLLEIVKLPLLVNDRKNFFYHVYLCDEHGDLRKYGAFAEELIKKSWKFGARLFSLMEIVFGKNTFNAGKFASKMWW